MRRISIACAVLMATPSAFAKEDDAAAAPNAIPSAATSTLKIADAANVPFTAQPGATRVKFNLQDADLAELVNHISGLTGRRFIFGDKIRQIKATVVSPEPVTLEEAYQAFLSILNANGMTVVPHGRFLKIVDSGAMATQSTPLIARGEPVPDSDRFVTRLYRLQHASSDDAVALLGKFKSKDGDVSVYAPGKLLVITDTATQIRRLERILEEIDVGGVGQHLWIEPVQHGSADALAKQVAEIFEVGTSAAAAGASGENSALKASGLTKLVADEALNALIIVGTKEGYLRLLEVMKRLDAGAAESSKIHILPLQHAIAEELAQTLTQMLGARGSAGPSSQSANGVSPGTFEGELRVTPDKSTNSLIVTASNRDFAMLELVIKDLDHARRQVFIEAVVMDLSVADSNTLGFSFHGGSTLGAQGDSLLLAGFQAQNSVGFPAADASLLQGFAAGITGPAIPGTTNLLGTGLSVPEFGVVLNAVASSGRSNILATPHIIATDNVAAEISVGENIPLQTNVGNGLSALSSAASSSTSAASLLSGLGGTGAAPRQDVGNKIKITPHINESNQVRLEIDQESSAQGATSGTLGAVSITKRTANTTVIVQDQQTVVIGGLMNDSYTTTRTKVPVLGDLPLLGALFRSTVTEKSKKNLLLVLTPHVIRDQEDLRKIFERKMQERQEFLDRSFVFSDGEWKPPHDWSRTHGLLEDIRKSYAEVAEQERLERASKRPEAPPHTPSAPIDLPEDGAGDSVSALPTSRP